MKDAPRMLIMSESPPADSYVASLWMRDICALYPSDLLYGFWPSKVQGSLASFPILINSFRPRSFSSLGHLRWIVSYIYDSIAISMLVRRIVSFGHQHQVRAVLVTLHENLLIKTALRVSKALAAPLFSLVYDPQEYTLRGYPPFIYRSLLRQYSNTLESSAGCAVMSNEMGEHFRNKYKVRTVTLHHGIPRHSWVIESQSFTREEWIIGFAGAMYAPQEFDALLQALDLCRWQIAGKPVHLRIYGSQITLQRRFPADIRYLGLYPVEQTIRELSHAHVLYLPYRFSLDFREAAQYSFPTKLSTYIAAGAPILYHGPDNSAVSHFMEKYPVGIECHSVSPDEILSALNTLLMSETLKSLANFARMQALEEEIGSHVFRMRFAEFLDIDENILRGTN